MKRRFFFIVTILLPMLSNGQDAREMNMTGFHFLEYNNELPGNFLSTKAAVFVEVPRSIDKPQERGDWRSLSEKTHAQFKRMGIDAVAYYYIDDLVAGNDPNLAFSKEMTRRRIKNLIILSEVRKQGISHYSIVITPFNGTNTFISRAQKAWRLQGPDLRALLTDLGKDVYRSKQPKTNFMIMDVPEFFTTTDIIHGKRFPVYATDLKVDKLAVPLFQPQEMPEEGGTESGTIDEEIKSKVEAYNAKTQRNNDQLKQIMESYLLKYAISEKYTDDDLYKEGYDYVLLRLHTTGVTIRELLGYQIDRSETDYITVKSGDVFNPLRRISVNTPVYKYYVKHLYTKDIYIGNKWDADLTWQEALANFINNMHEALKVKK